MHNPQSFFKTNIQTFLFVFAILVLALSNTYLMVQAQEGDESKQTEQDQSQFASSITPTNLENNVPLPPNLFPHSNCIQRLVMTTAPSNVYDGSDPYNLAFYRGNLAANFQDINGDGLPDYVMAYSTVNGAGNSYSNYESCVYLNNGNGWTKVYECYAITEINPTSQTIIRGEYYGDCAGTPNSKE